MSNTTMMTSAGPFPNVEVLELVAVELFLQRQQEVIPKSPDAVELWRRERSERDAHRKLAKELFDRLGEFGIKINAGRAAAVSARVAEITTIPARTAYNLGTDLND